MSIVSPIVLALHTEADTQKLAAMIADQLSREDCLLLYGDVGAGKTTFMRYLLEHLTQGEVGQVVSPSFMLMQTYDVMLEAKEPATLHHIDGYRLECEEEVYELGVEELAQSSVLCIEWPEKFVDFLPESRLSLTIELGRGEGRNVTLSALGGWCQKLKKLREYYG